jgi:hypothetical protein
MVNVSFRATRTLDLNRSRGRTRAYRRIIRELKRNPDEAPELTRVYEAIKKYQFRFIRSTGVIWIRSEFKQYVVRVGGTCTCPHHSYRGIPCKHIKAVQYIYGRGRLAQPI